MITNRKNTHKVMVKNIQIGRTNRVVIQSMTNTKTSNVPKTLKQINELVQLGCQLVRVAVLDNNDCLALKQIVKKSLCPIIADIHYNHQFAIDAINAGVSKIRINPANIPNIKHLQQIVMLAKKHSVAIRLGFNKGSYRKISNDQLINQAIYYIKKLEA
jgi:(E)-4-hydroxy-3-methylbut-2-enyl-diphosphate synthase